MPPHLHPRSTATSTLFAGTLLASFIVVALPHILPCPSRRKIGYQDTEIIFDAEGKPIKRLRKGPHAPNDRDIRQVSTPVSETSNLSLSSTKVKSFEEEAELFQKLRKEAELIEVKDRECPVPKPRTLLGRLVVKEMSSD